MHHIIIRKNVDNIDSIVIDKVEFLEDYNHLVNSLRVRVGENIRVDIIPIDEIEDSINNKNVSYIGKIINIDEDSIEILHDTDVMINELPIFINLYQGLPKQDKLEFIVEKATELGVFSITPISMKNCIKKMDDSDVKKLDRLQKIAHQAALQSMRHIVPKVNKPIDYDKMIDKITLESDCEVYNLLCYEDTKDIKNIKEIVEDIKNNIAKDKKIIVNIIIGPEGGFDLSEIEKAKGKNITLCSLGDRILRTETAPIVALSQFINL